MSANQHGAERAAHPDMRERALALASLGYRVFPLQALGKTPIHKNFPSVASSDAGDVHALWTNALGEPENFNIGIATGKGIVAVDYDVKDGRSGFTAKDEFDAKGMPASIRTATPSGGEHLILSLDPSIIIGSSVQKIAPGVDTRGRNSYIVAPGSEVLDEKGATQRYRFISEKRAVHEADPVPEFFMPLLLQHSRYNDSPKDTMPLVDLDQPSAVKRAIQYLQNDAPEALEGAGGDQTTFAVAARLHDFGISEDFALDLLIEFWNEQKASPPWSIEELKRKVANAFKYAQNPHGALSPQAEFEPVAIDESLKPAHLASTVPDDPDWPRPHSVTQFDPFDLPPRDFVFEGLFARRTVSALVAPSGAGKTQMLIQMALALATGDQSLGFTPTKRNRAVWLWNQEDDTDELKRRLYAAMLHFNIEFGEFDNRLFIDSGVDKRLTLAAKTKLGTLAETKHVNRIIDRIKQNNIAVFIVDPLVEFHQAEENDNVQMAHVAGILRRIAVEADCAVIMGHHDRKPDNASSSGHVGNQNSMRGASALQGVTRAIATMYTMSQQDAKEFNVAEDQRHRYLRFDSAKNNLAIAGGRPQWFMRMSQPLTFEGEVVGVLKPVELVASRVEKEGPGGGDAGDDEARFTELAEALLALDAAARALGRPPRDGWHKWPAVLDRMLGESPVSPRTWKRWMSGRASGAFKVSPLGLVVRVKRAGDRDVRLRLEPVVKQKLPISLKAE